jgi:hypothetical protein
VEAVVLNIIDRPNQQEDGTMIIQKMLVTASLGGLLFVGAPGMLLGQQATQGQTQPGETRQQQSTKSISGKVMDIGDQGHSFTVETDNGGAKQTMKFVVDKNTQVQGQVKVGTMVAVDYQPTDGGQLLCVRVAAQNS